MSVSAEIADLIRRVARISSPNLLLPVCDELEQLPADADFEHITSLLRHVQHGDTRTCLLEIVSAIKSQNLQVNAASLSLALRSAILSLESQSEETVLELVWSGPLKPFSTIRRTDQALADIIAESQQSILIVSFAVYKVPGIMSSLREAADRGVSVKIIIETEKDSHGKLRFDGLEEMKAAGLDKADLYVWPVFMRPKAENGRAGLLHAKCAVSDSRVALVSSANLTEAAMNVNMELGLVVRGGNVPADIAEHFEKLISSGVLCRKQQSQT